MQHTHRLASTFYRFMADLHSTKLVREGGGGVKGRGGVEGVQITIFFYTRWLFAVIFLHNIPLTLNRAGHTRQMLRQSDPGQTIVDCGSTANHWGEIPF